AIFILSNQICESDIVLTKCGAGSNYHNPEIQFCNGNDVVNKCGGITEYIPGKEECCGSGKRNIASQFCYNNSKAGDYCGTREDEYDPDLYQCKPTLNPNGIYLKTPVHYEGEDYEAVLIGDQTWLARNLNYNANGSVCYDNNEGEDYYSLYGRLYDWATAMDLDASCNSISCTDQIETPHQGLCPIGWHMPTNAEWNELYRYADGTLNGSTSNYESLTAGKHLKSKEGWANCSASGSSYSCLDTHGFAALPGGYVYSDGFLDDAGNSGNWWKFYDFI
ncbi:MAG: hypothetical protein LBB36_00320, partial [Fibromonadaceae bacterium]|nr:hypothetical protein [Fibromonadaceae bacterium]